jgi:hypothetical protein
MNRLSPLFIAEFGELMANELKMTSNECLKSGMDILSKHKLLKKVKKVHPKFFLTHKENRNRLMLNGKNCHKKGAVIERIGADRKQLSTAVCTEIAPSGPTRVSNLEANQALIKRSGGLLAPMNGEELYLSLGCGHTVAFCKVAPLCPATAEKSLQDKYGYIDYAKLLRQSEFKAMMEEGWDWDVIPWDVDQMFPKFANIVQKALNGSNSASTEIGELDTALNLADLQAELGAAGENVALKSVQDMCMSCAPYCHIINDFVKLYGGGPGAPHITFMDSIGKAFNSTMVLGEQYWHGITYLTFTDKTCMYPLLRVALALVNLTSDKQEHGIAKLLVKSDLNKITQKSSAALAWQAEETLQQSFEIVDLLAQKTGTSKEQVLQPLGQLFVRIALAALVKGKVGPDAKDHSIKDIQQLYLLDIAKIIGTPINYPPWGAATPAAAVAEDQALKPMEAAPSLHDHTSATWIAKKAGFEIGNVVWERTGPGTSMQKKFLITGIDDIGAIVHVKMSAGYDLAAEPFVGQVPLKDMLQSWSVGTGQYKEPVLLKIRANRTAALSIDFCKIEIFKAIHEADQIDNFNLSLRFWRQPDMVRTGEEQIPKGKLVLVPVMCLSNIVCQTEKNTQPGGLPLGTHKVDGHDVKFFGTASAKPSFKTADDEMESVMMAAFWWVGTTNDKEFANMELQQMTANGMKIPIMKNCQVIKPFTRLMKFSPLAAAPISTLKAVPQTTVPVPVPPVKKSRKS